MGDIIELFIIALAVIIGVPVGLSLLIFAIRRIFLSVSGEAKRTPAKDTLESSFGCVFMTILCVILIVWILTVI